MTAILSDAPASELTSITDRLEAAVERADEIPDSTITELRSAIDLLRSGRTYATISALLAVRSEFGGTPG